MNQPEESEAISLPESPGARQESAGILARLRRLFLRSAPHFYHLWYYNNHVWTETRWMDVPTLKSPSDMWNYQEILVELKPSVIIEFGTYQGGSALFFASIMRQIGGPFAVLSVDVDRQQIAEKALADPDITFLTMSSTDALVKEEIAEMRHGHPGPAFVILDSDHSKQHVLAELMSLRYVLRPGDYLIVESSNVNDAAGATRGPSEPGPHDAIEEYFRKFPNDYVRDTEREKKFGFTFSPHGFLRRS